MVIEEKQRRLNMLVSTVETQICMSTPADIADDGGPRLCITLTSPLSSSSQFLLSPFSCSELVPYSRFVYCAYDAYFPSRYLSLFTGSGI